jgi:hypothetical protein
LGDHIDPQPAQRAGIRMDAACSPSPGPGKSAPKTLLIPGPAKLARLRLVRCRPPLIVLCR